MRSLAGLARIGPRRAPEVRASTGTGDAALSWWDIISTLGASMGQPGRDEAMQVPALAACRNLVANTIGQLDLLHIEGTARVDGFDPIATDPNPAMPRSVHYAWVAEDLLLRGQSTLVVLARGVGGEPTRVRRVLPGQVVYLPTADAFGTKYATAVVYNGRPIPPADVLVISGPHEGILRYGSNAIATALAFERAARRFADVPLAATELHQTGGDPLTDPEIDALVDRWIEARKASGVAFTNDTVDVRDHGWNPRELALNEARQQCALAIANTCGVEPASISAQVPGSTLTYQNAQQVREGNWLNAIRPIATPIAEAFTSWCLPAGHVYRWDADGYTRDSFENRVNTGAVGVRAGLFTADEWRAREAWPPLPEGVLEIPTANIRETIATQLPTPSTTPGDAPAASPATAGVSP